MKSKTVIIPIFIPHKGCPFDCIYCNQKTISGQTEEMDEQKMRSIIENHISSIQDDAHVEIGFYGGSFTGIEKDLQIEYLKIANEYVIKNKVKEIRLSTRPDYINRQILEYLKYYNVRTIELGVQSLDENVLRISCRGHSVEQVLTAAQLTSEYGFNLGIQTMIGLPGDNREKDIATARKVISMHPKIVRIYPALVIKNTFMEEMYLNGVYNPLVLYEAVDICSDLLAMYEENNIKVIRIGLQPTDNINDAMDVIAGPFHPSFRHLVESKLILKNIENYILINKLDSCTNITIVVNKLQVSNVIGIKKSNIEYLKRKFAFNKISVNIDESMQNKSFTVISN